MSRREKDLSTLPATAREEKHRVKLQVWVTPDLIELLDEATEASLLPTRTHLVLNYLRAGLLADGYLRKK